MKTRSMVESEDAESEDEYGELPPPSQEEMAGLDAAAEAQSSATGPAHPRILEARKKLKEIFGYDSFRLLQEQAIHRLLVEQKNGLVLFPTGGGKSLCFQIPALLLPGLTVVVSPLISLMKDQVDTLRRKGVAAAALDSSLSAEETFAVKDGVRDGTLKILYVAPERLNNESFHEMIRSIDVSLLAVDESHCVSEWGASFRPEYLKVARFAEEVQAKHVLCLTATATPKVASDICESFAIENPAGIFKTPVFRPNLHIHVKQARNIEHKVDQLVPILKARTGPCIVYVAFQRHTEEVAKMLSERGISGALTYHGGMNSEDRKKVQDLFMTGENHIVVGTIAFGMGIDLANIRIVAHLFFAKSLESYSQEIGRAGRDGLLSNCYMFLQNSDISILEGFARGDTCSKKSVVSWLTELASLEEDAGDPGVISISAYSQAKDFDIRPTMLGIMHAQLELFHSCIRTLTPTYSTYDIKPRADSKERYNEIFADTSPAAVAIRASMSKHVTWTSIDVAETAKRSGLPRQDIQRCVNRWEIQGMVDSKVSGVRARYAIGENPIPRDAAGIEELATAIHDLAVEREERDVGRLIKVVETVTASECTPKLLSKHFGDDLTTPTGTCTTCTFCTTGKATPFLSPVKLTDETPLPPAKIKAILAVVPVRDDARFLARYAFGISSPRVTSLKLGRHPTFGSMDDCNFTGLIKAFGLAIPHAGAATAYAPAAPAPRTYGNASYGRGGRAGGASGSGSSRGKSGASARGGYKPYAKKK